MLLDRRVQVEPAAAHAVARCTTPPIETTAISERAPPISTIRCPIGSWIGRPAPIAAASASSTRVTCFPPLDVTASSTARFSTSELSDGMQIKTRGFGNRPGATRRSTEPR